MPTYQYRCRHCGYEMEEFQSISEPPLSRCPSCSTDNLARILGAGSGLIFKGTGFYLTDYRKSSSGPSEGTTPKESPKKEGGPPPAPPPPKSDSH